MERGEEEVECQSNVRDVREVRKVRVDISRRRYTQHVNTLNIEMEGPEEGA